MTSAFLIQISFIVNIDQTYSIIFFCKELAYSNLFSTNIVKHSFEKCCLTKSVENMIRSTKHANEMIKNIKYLPELVIVLFVVVIEDSDGKSILGGDHMISPQNND